MALVAIFATGTAFADHPSGLGIGIIGYYPGGGGLSLKLPSMPIFWAINAGVSKDNISFHLTGDKYMIDSILVKEAALHWFLGLGGWLSFYNYSRTSEDKVDYSYARLAFGARIPIGISWQPIPLLEIFIDIAPSLGFGIDSEGKTNNIVYSEAWAGFVHYWPIEFGLRLWF